MKKGGNELPPSPAEQIQAVLLNLNQLWQHLGRGRRALSDQLLGLGDERLDDVSAGDLTHRATVLEDHADALAEGDAELRVVRLAGGVDLAAHDGEVERLLDVREPPLDLGHDLDEVLHVEPPARRAGDNRHPSVAQFQRLEYLPRDAHLFPRLGRERDADGVADAFVQKDAETNGRLDGAAE